MFLKVRRGADDAGVGAACGVYSAYELCLTTFTYCGLKSLNHGFSLVISVKALFT